MNPAKVERSRVKNLTDLPNIGKASAADLQLLGIHEPQQLVGLNPYQMYQRLCDITQVRHDPCVIDVFISITRFMDGEAPRPWWDYTDERKQSVGQGERR
jgi:Pathogenicity locus